MNKRTVLSQRKLPRYSRGEEIMNMVTHIVGGALAIIILILCLCRSWGSGRSMAASLIYGLTMVCLYTFSSIYHGLLPCTAKKVMQIIDHCTIYFLIVGTYTAVLLPGIIPVHPVIGWALLAAEWTLAIIATVLTAIDLHNYRVFSMICYIAMGWGIILFIPQTLQVLSLPGFLYLLSGGIAYTIGAVLFGIGSKIPWIHSVFHIFVVLGSLLQFICIYFYVI